VPDIVSFVMQKMISTVIVGLFFLAGGSFAFDAERAVVVKIIDGDTLGITFQGRYEKLRLIGIDTPESRRNNRAWRQADQMASSLEEVVRRGKEAKRYVAGLLKKDMIVFVELDVQHRDRYRRLLGYLYLPGGEMLNEKLLREGYASLLTIPPNVKYRDRFVRAFRQGRRKSAVPLTD